MSPDTPLGLDAPVLRLAGYEGPLDALLDEARAGRVDLQRLSVLALVEQCVAALDAALCELRASAGNGGSAHAPTAGASPMPAPPSAALQRLAEWLVMAAWLAWLRTRLLLPEHDPEARAARAEAEAFRRGLAERAAVRTAADWLDARPQLGRDVFACGMALDALREDAERVAAELATLLHAYARRIEPMPGQGRAADAAAYRPRPPRLWRVQDATRWFERLLGEVPDTATRDDAGLWRFLPDAGCLAAAGLVADAVPDPALLDRSAAASTLVAALELARQGQLTLAQKESFGSIQVRAAQDATTNGGVDH